MTEPDAFANDMRAIGLEVSSPWDLVSSRRSYSQAVPILIDWLERADAEVPAGIRERFREGVVRSLAVKEARGVAGPALLREFHRPEVSSLYRWAVGNSLEVVATDDIFDGLAEIAQDSSFGADRQMVVLALGRTSDPDATQILLGLLDDEAVAGHAIMALGKIRSPESRPALERCLKHPKAWVRREAKKALVKLDR